MNSAAYQSEDRTTGTRLGKFSTRAFLPTSDFASTAIDEASAKVRSGPPLDNEKDYGSPVWAGVLPLEVRSRTPIPDDNLVEGVAVPDYVLSYDARLDGADRHSSKR